MKPSEMIVPVAIAVVIGYFALGWFATRTQSLYVQGCQLKSNSELTPEDRNNQKVSDVRATARYCQCMGNSFYLNNGKVRLALLETGLFGASDIFKPTGDEEAKCARHAIGQVASEAVK
jgi:hypothetical protein